MAFTRVCAEGDIPAGGMDSFFVDGWEVLVLRDTEGRLHAVDGMCPHQDSPLVDGDFDGTILTCLYHYWSFDATTGLGINPPTCRLAKYAIEVREGQIHIDRDTAPA